MTPRTEAILAGGPEHGRRLKLHDGVKEYVTVAALPPQDSFLARPRPPWWRPLKRRRWKPPVPSPPSVAQRSYRRDGQLADGTLIYWFREGLSVRPPAEGELYPFLVDALYAVPPRDRMDARWVMDLEWYKKCRRHALQYAPDAEDDEEKWIPSSRDELLGKPVTVTEDGGVPHLEVSRNR
jgi:hypothetical protein